jgi:hypothetical protein
LFEYLDECTGAESIYYWVRTAGPKKGNPKKLCVRAGGLSGERDGDKRE